MKPIHLYTKSGEVFRTFENDQEVLDAFAEGYNMLRFSSPNAAPMQDDDALNIIIDYMEDQHGVDRHNEVTVESTADCVNIFVSRDLA